MDLASALELATDLRPRSRLLADLPLTFTTVPDKAAGDIYTEAMWDTYTRDNLNAGVWRAIADTVLVAPASTFDFQSIPATFAHLALLLTARGDTVAVSVGLVLRFNNDSTASYDWELQSAQGATTAGSEGIAATSFAALAISAASAPANVFSSHRFEIENYANAANQKSGHSEGAVKTSAATGGIFAQSASLFWRNTAAINRITLSPATGNFVTGSRATLIGIPN